MIVGIDSISPASAKLITSAAQRMKRPVAWMGRYIQRSASTAEYDPVIEAATLAAAGVKHVQIFARQTNRVGGTREMGIDDGANNAEDLLNKFGTRRMRIFLDVEGSKPSLLSAEYYKGWTDGLEAIGGADIMPCVYGLPGDSTTWQAIQDSTRPCYGVCLARPYNADWATSHEPIQWTASMLSAYHWGWPIISWQYAFYGAFDAQLLNPELDADTILATFPETS